MSNAFPPDPVLPNRFIHRHRVIYGECTLGNHVYYARYLDFLESARGEFFRNCGFPMSALQDAGVLFPVVEVQLRYFAAARYDDVLAIQIAVQRMDRVRLDFHCTIGQVTDLGDRSCGEPQETAADAGNEQRATRRSAWKPLVEGVTRHVCTDLKDRPRRIPTELAAALQPWRILEE